MEAAWHQVHAEDFARFDIDGDGYLDKREVQQLLQHQLNREPHPDEMTSFFRELDLNDDGRVTLDEYIISVTPLPAAGFGAWWAANSVPYAEDVSILLEEALARGEPTCGIIIDGSPFTVNFGAMRQYNKQDAPVPVVRNLYKSCKIEEEYPIGLPTKVRCAYQTLLNKRIDSLNRTHGSSAVQETAAKLLKGDAHSLRANAMLTVNSTLCARALNQTELCFNHITYREEDRHGGYGSSLEFKPSNADPEDPQILTFLLTDGGASIQPIRRQGCEESFVRAVAAWRAPSLGGWKFDTQTHAVLYGMTATWELIRKMTGLADENEQELTASSWAMAVIAEIASAGLCSGKLVTVGPAWLGKERELADGVPEGDRVKMSGSVEAQWFAVNYGDQQCLLVGPGEAWCAGETRVWLMDKWSPKECAAGLFGEPEPMDEDTINDPDLALAVGWMLTGTYGPCGPVPIGDPWKSFGLFEKDFKEVESSEE